MDLKNTKSSRVSGIGNYFTIWVSLIMLTGVLITFAGMSHSNIVIIISLAVAVFEAFLVLRFFTRLGVEKKTFAVFSSLSLLILLVTLILLLPESVL